MLPVRETPPLPYPTGDNPAALSGFNNDLVKALYQYLSEVARRVNQTLPKDGTEAMTGSLNIGGFNIINVGTITGTGTATFGALHVTGTSTLDGQTTQGGLLNLTSGQIAFPATQIPSSNVNTLDDYEEGTWTPTITFATPGNLSVTYSQRQGVYQKIGNTVTLSFTIATSAFTHTTASGNARITGLPFNISGVNIAEIHGVLSWGQFTTVASQIVLRANSSNSTFLDMIASASGAARSVVSTTQLVTGTTLFLSGTITYQV